MRGVVLKKAGKNAQVDFSESGGDSKKWEKCTDLTIASTMQIHETESEPPVPERPPSETEQSVAEATDTDEDTGVDEDVTTASHAPSAEGALATPLSGGHVLEQSFVVGVRVQRLGDPSAHGKIVKRQDRRIRVDFSASGGPSSAWLELAQIECCQAGDPPAVDGDAGHPLGGDTVSLSLI